MKSVTRETSVVKLDGKSEGLEMQSIIEVVYCAII